jgi:SAM-dependent methyltransferase
MRSAIKKTVKNTIGLAMWPVFNAGLLALCQKYVSGYFQHVFWRQWRKEAPHWFDHRIDLFRWPTHLNPHFLERGFYAREVMWAGCKVLDICCGDGFYAYYFYQALASQIDGIDIDDAALKNAQQFHRSDKIRYARVNVLTEPLPDTGYDVVCFDAALGHFSKEELDVLFKKIIAALAPNGVLVGYEEMEEPAHQTWDHKIALPTPDDFRALLAPYFKHVKVLPLQSAGRNNLYFRCTQGEATLLKGFA